MSASAIGNKSKPCHMKAMIFAAGMGTRLKPVTDTLPKALVRVGDKPLLEHVARKLMASGINEAVVNVHHFAEMVVEWIASQDWISTESSARPEGCMLMHVSDERDRLLETGGAVLHARPYLEGCGQFLIYNVDIISDIDLAWFASEVKEGALATLLVSERSSSRSLVFDKDTMRLLGWMNNITGEVRSPFRIDPETSVRLAFSGIHVMSDRIFDVLARYATLHGLDLSYDNPRFPVMDFYIWACASYEIYGVEAGNMRLIDVGKLDSLEKAEMFIR